MTAPAEGRGARIRIAVITHVDPRGHYGSATSLRLHLRALASDPSLEFAVFTPGVPAGPCAADIGAIGDLVQPARIAVRPNYRDVSSLARAFSALNRLRHPPSATEATQLSQWRPDVIHLNSLTLEPMIAWLARQPRLAGVPIVASVRESLEPGLRRSRRRLLGGLHHYVCISRVTQQHLIEALRGEIAPRTSVIENLVSRPSPMAQPRTGRAGRGPTFAAIGRLEPLKGPHRILAGFRRARIPGAQLLIIGGGRHPLRLWLALRARVTPGVTLVGVVPDLTASSTFADIDIVVRADRRYSGLGRVGQEALAAGRVLVLPAPGREPVSAEEQDADAQPDGPIVWSQGRSSSALATALTLAAERDRRRTRGSSSAGVDRHKRPPEAAGESTFTAYRQQWCAVYHEAAQPPGTQARRTLSHADGSDPEPCGTAQEDTPSSAAHR